MTANSTLTCRTLSDRGIFGVLTPAFAFAKLVAEWYIQRIFLIDQADPPHFQVLSAARDYL